MNAETKLYLLIAATGAPNYEEAMAFVVSARVKTRARLRAHHGSWLPPEPAFAGLPMEAREIRRMRA